MTAAPTDVLLLACYELGHQPLSLAWPAAVLRRAGVPVTAVDLAVDPFPRAAAAQAHFVGISVPMHTALRLGVRAAQDVRALNPDAHICFYGLYAWLNAGYLLATWADSVLAGEIEEALVGWVAQAEFASSDANRPRPRRASEDAHSVWDEWAAEAEFASSDANGPRPRRASEDAHSTRDGQPQSPILTRLALPTPDRSGLPPLDRYAHYVDGGVARPAGYVEASRGCLHTCRHCPIVPVYGGRFFVVPAETVLADVRQQVAAGAEHITFGDPDFLNGPGHVLKIVRALHAEFPRLTFDFTTKVEHIRQHRALFPELRALGAGFVISAFESVSDDVLARLGKGHTAADLDDALAVLAGAGLPVQPTWLPFTPWTTLDDYVALLAWIRRRDLIAHVPAVQLSIRLLVPPGSALLDGPDAAAWLGPLDAANFTYQWRNPDPCVDELQRRVAAVAEAGGDADVAFAAIERLAYGLAGRRPPDAPPHTHTNPAPPRLTEDWFC
jgi:radical SAM superfamily enzyme YgiQ (UPF0313 family)